MARAKNKIRNKTMQILMFQSIIFTEIHNIIYALKPSLEFRMVGQV